MTQQRLPAGAIARLGTMDLKVRWRWPEQMDFAPDGSCVWASSSWDGAVRAWEVSSGAARFVLEDARPAKVVTAPERGAIVLLDNAGFGRFVDPGTGEHRGATAPLDDASPLTMDSATLTVDRCGERVAGCHGGKAIFVKRLSTGQLMHRLELPGRSPGAPVGVGFLGNGEHVVASQYRIVRAWSTASGEVVGEFELPEKTGSGFRTLPGTDRAMSWRFDYGSGVTHVEVWRALLGERVHQVAVVGEVVCHAVSVDGAWAAVLVQRPQGDAVVTLSLERGEVVSELATSGRRANRLAVTCGGRHVATAHYESPRVHLWDAITGEELHRGSGHDGAIRRVCFAGSGLVSCGDDGTLVATRPLDEGLEVIGRRGDAREAWWDVDRAGSAEVVAATRAGAVSLLRLPTLAEGEVLLPEGEAVQVRHIDGLLPELWAVGHPDQLEPSMPPCSSNVIRVDVHQRRVVERGTSPFNLGGAFAMSPTGEVAAVADYRQAVLLETRHGGLVRRVGWAEGEKAWALTGAMAFHPATAALAVGCHGGQIGALAPDAPSLVLRFDAVDEEDNAVTALCFVAGGAVLAAGYQDGRIRLWGWGEERLLVELEGHLAAVTTLAGSNDGRMLASGSDDTTVLLWSLEACLRAHDPSSTRTGS